MAFLEGRFLSSQSEQSEKFSKSIDWLEKSRPSKKPLLFWLCKQANGKFNIILQGVPKVLGTFNMSIIEMCPRHLEHLYLSKTKKS